MNEKWKNVADFFLKGIFQKIQNDELILIPIQF